MNETKLIANYKKYRNGYLFGLIAIRPLLLDRSTTNPAQYEHPDNLSSYRAKDDPGKNQAKFSVLPKDSVNSAISPYPSHVFEGVSHRV